MFLTCRSYYASSCVTYFLRETRNASMFGEGKVHVQNKVSCEMEHHIHHYMYRLACTWISVSTVALFYNALYPCIIFMTQRQKNNFFLLMINLLFSSWELSKYSIYDNSSWFPLWHNESQLTSLCKIEGTVKHHFEREDDFVHFLMETCWIEYPDQCGIQAWLKPKRIVITYIVLLWIVQIH